MVHRALTILPLAALAFAHGDHQARNASPEVDALNRRALQELAARHPHVRAEVLGGDAEFERVARERRQAVAPTARASASRASVPAFTGTLPGLGTAGGSAVGSINSAGLAAIAVETSAEPNLPVLPTPTAGSSAPISGAPALPAATIVPAQWPTLDIVPPTDSAFVQGLLRNIDLTKVPNIPPTQLGGCQNASNAAALAAASTNCWWTCGGCTRASDITVCPNTNTWGLSYDDGPSFDTPRLLTYLDAQSPPVKSTFFVVGSRAISRPAMLQYEYVNNHQICVHTWSHTALTTQSNEQIVAELGWTREAIRQITGVSPNCMRPPYGDIDDRVRYLSAALGMQPVIWTSANGRTFDTQDWQIGAGVVSAGQSAQNFVSILQTAPTLSTGFVVLAHDLYQQSVSLALDFVLPYALSQGTYKLEPIITCLGKPISEGYIETSRNQSATATGAKAGSTGTGTVANLPSAVNVAGGGTSQPRSGAPSSLALPSAVALVLAPILAALAFA